MTRMDWLELDYQDDVDQGSWRRREREQYGREDIIGSFNPVRVGDVAVAIVDVLSRYFQMQGKCDSPIEEILGAHTMQLFADCGHPLTFCEIDNVSDHKVGTLLIVPQFRFSKFRADWGVFRVGNAQALLIECDGQDYHSSPEAVARDTARDASAHALGHLTMRFWGRQIVRDPRKCARMIFDATGLEVIRASA
jgi:very-short-patch-repair endonuclease